MRQADLQLTPRDAERLMGSLRRRCDDCERKRVRLPHDLRVRS